MNYATIHKNIFSASYETKLSNSRPTRMCLFIGFSMLLSINTWTGLKTLLTLRSNLIYYSMDTKTERQKLNRIKAVLAETGHTGKWLAQQLGKDPVTVSKWCTNTSQPDLYTLKEISLILNTEIHTLIYK